MVAEENLSNTENWDTIENVFYRREQIYSMAWDFEDLSDFQSAAAKFGGPVALKREERKLTIMGAHSSGRPKIDIYNAVGFRLATLPWDLQSLIHFSWTAHEHLFTLVDTGVYRIYELSGEYRQYSLGSEVESLGVISAQAYDDGFVALLGDLSLMHVKGWEGGRPTLLSNPNLQEIPRSWFLVPPDLSNSRHIEVIISSKDTVLVTDEIDTVDQRLSRGPFTDIRMSPNGKFLAFVSSDLSLWVASSTFDRTLSEVDIATLDGNYDGSAPEMVEWCGDHAVALGWKDGRVLIVSPGGECLSYTYPPGVVIVGEIDGLRIISASVSDFVQKVPASTLAVFQPGSTSPAAILFDAKEQFDRKSARADEAIRSVKSELPGAVDTCVEAAGLERDPKWQKKLLNAATFGRAFLDLYNPTDLVNMGQVLRVLNAVRQFEVGIPLTYPQYMAAPADRLISRLTALNMHLLALRISSFMHLRPDPVLKHWACSKIAAAQYAGGGASQDDHLRRVIVDKFEKEGMSVCYADIAKKAWQLGRTKLATKLLEHERQAAQQVPLLLAMKEDRLALVRAVHSNDPDLVIHVLLDIRSRLTPGDFFALVDDGTSELAPAIRLLEVYAKESDRDLLRDLYYQDDRRLDSAMLELEEAWSQPDPEDRISHLKNAAKYFSEDKARHFEAKVTDEARKLLVQQQSLESEIDAPGQMVGLSLSDTLTELLYKRMDKRAEKLKNDWKVTDKRWWWIKLRALIVNKDWDGLESFAKSKKSPIGYEPFVTRVLEAGQPSRAASFVSRCDAKRRVDLYLQCGDWGRAANECKERGDKARLEELRKTAPSGLPQREVDEVVRRAVK